MLLKLYGLLSLMVFALAIGPFWHDPSEPRKHLDQWLFLALAVALSPVVLPNMVLRRLSSLKARPTTSSNDEPHQAGTHRSQ
jgi:hypothetical protein